MKKQNYSPVLFKNFCKKKKKKSKHLLSRTLFVDYFRYIERITEKKLKCFLHTALVSNEKKGVLSASEGTKWKVQYLLKLKVHLVSFVFGFRYQISGKNKSKRFRSMVDLEPVKSASTVLSV